jgi:predicted ribosomally synthesized peptide with SipW-like signal peptide
MKATKKIVGAACALVAAVALSAGSTFAWFTSNDKVSVDGLKASVKSDGTYLLISHTDYSSTTSAASIQTSIWSEVNENNNLAKYSFSNTDYTNLFPTAHTLGGESVTTSNFQWYYMYSNNVSTSTGVTSTKHIIGSDNSDNLNDYVIKETFYITTAKNTYTAQDLYVSTIKFTQETSKTNLPVKVLVVCGDNWSEFSPVKTTTQGTVEAKSENGVITNTYTYNSNASGHTNNSLAAEVGTTSSPVVKVDLYIYYDGEDETLTTNNFDTISKLDLEIEIKANSVSTTQTVDSTTGS